MMEAAGIQAKAVEMPKKQVKKRSQIMAIWFRYKKNKLAVAGLVLLILLVLVAVCAPLIVPYERVVEQNLVERLAPISAEHWFGTDEYGRDMFARIIWGARYSLALGMGSIIISLIFGALIGAVCGYFGGKLDNIVMRVMDVLLAIPQILMAICIVAALGQSALNLLIAMSASTVPKFVRIVRSSVLSLKQEEYIEAARACGTGDGRIIFRHVLPNVLGPIIVQATITMAATILAISSLSFIGLGVPTPQPEWGTILSDNKSQMRYFPYLCTIPGIAILVSVIAMNLIGDGLRDALDPKLKN